MTMFADKTPDQHVDPDNKRLALFIWRKITTLQVVPCCGLCGTVRHQTKPYWSLGMRVCRQCMQVNLVSSVVLYERFWINPRLPIRGNITFIDLIHLNTFYFPTDMTRKQRLEYSTDPLDFSQGGVRSVWFFWKPHLQQILDLHLLAVEAKRKTLAAAQIRGAVRRLCVRRILGHPVYFLARKDRRTMLAQVLKAFLLNCADRLMGQKHQSVSAVEQELSADQFMRLQRGVDRMPPLMFA